MAITTPPPEPDMPADVADRVRMIIDRAALTPGTPIIAAVECFPHSTCDPAPYGQYIADVATALTGIEHEYFIAAKIVRPK